MSRANKAWFSFRGIESTDVDAWLVSAPVFAQGAWRGDSKTVIGRDGDVFVSDGCYDTSEIKVKLRFRMSRLDDVMAWLTGSGWLVFAWARNRAYRARVEKKLDYKYGVPGLNPIMQVEVTFLCQPFRYQWPEPKAFEITASGTEFINPGTAPSLPRVKITGSGDFTVTISGQELAFSNVTGSGIIVDSYSMDALSYDGTEGANGKMSGTPWTIAPGKSTVAWTAESGSSVTKIEILPRWRYY